MVDLDQLIVLQLRMLSIGSTLVHIEDLIWGRDERIGVIAGGLAAWPIHIISEVHAPRIPDGSIASRRNPCWRLSESPAFV